MGEKKTAKLIPYEVNYICDKCGKGIMEYTGGHEYLTSIPQFEHKCNVCGEIKLFYNGTYPKISYEKEEI